MRRIKKIRILISLPHRLPREVLAGLLNRESEFKIVGEVGSGPDVLEKASSLKPDIVLIFAVPFDPSCAETLRSLALTKARTIVLGGAYEAGWELEAIKIGARGVLRQLSTPEMLCKSIRAVAAGEYWVTRQTVGDLIENIRTESAAAKGARAESRGRVTEREWDITRAVVEGMTNKDIASSLGISEQTVKHHLTSIFEKIGVSNRLELAMFTMRRNK